MCHSFNQMDKRENDGGGVDEANGLNWKTLPLPLTTNLKHNTQRMCSNTHTLSLVSFRKTPRARLNRRTAKSAVHAT